MDTHLDTVQDVMTLKEAAGFLRVAEWNLASLARKREVPAKKVGRLWRFLRADLVKWMRKGD